MFKGSGKMELVVIAYRLADISDGQMRQLQKFGGFCHAVIHQEILRGPAHGIFEDFSKITPVQSAVIRDIFHGNVILEILLNVGKRFMDIEIAEFSGLGSDEPYRSDGAGERIQKKVQMPHKMKGGHVAVLGDVEHLLHHGFPNITGMSTVDGRVGGKSDNGKGFLYAESVKFQPDIFPWKCMVGNISSDLMGKDHKSLPALDLIGMGIAGRIIRVQSSGAGNDIMEQIMGTCSRTKTVGGCASLPSELIEVQIYKIFIGKYGE